MKKSELLALLILFFIGSASYGQNPGDKFKLVGLNPVSLPIEETFSKAAEIFPFDENADGIYGLAVSANVELKDDKSLVRLVLIDANFEEYLLYESYNLLVEEENSFSIQDICEETSLLDKVKPYAINIELENASLKLESITYTTAIPPGLDVANTKKENKKAQNQVKIRQINRNLQKKGKHWVAGETSVSELSYGQRKKLYGQSTFPSGFEYYTGGVILAGGTESSSTNDGILKSATVSSSSPYVDEWDWRDRHGKNWITSIKNQGTCGSCWAFSAIGATEAMVNLYFNQQLNLDLSEQDLISCSIGGDCVGGVPGNALDYIASSGVVDEATFPYSESNGSCINKGTNPLELIKIGGKREFGSSDYPRSEDILKKMLIHLGPLSGGLRDWSHAMSLVGYKVVKAGDVFYYRDLDLWRSWKTVTAGDPLIGKTVWIFKNSWGPFFGDEGYVYVETPLTNIIQTFAIETPVNSVETDRQVICEDRDGDGYYWWGLGPKPATCNGPDQPDGDDTNPDLGPIDQYGQCLEIGLSPIANFRSDKLVTTNVEAVAFSDISNNAMSWYWSFEGGNPTISTETNPVVSYSMPGTYDVTLTVSNTDGSDTKTIQNYISVEKAPYCESYGNAVEEWISSVQIGTQTNTSGSSGTEGYEDFSSFTFAVESGTTYNLTLTPDFMGESYGEGWNVWIDYNGDSDFNDAGELVSYGSYSAGVVNRTLKIPSNLNLTTGMRVAMQRNATSMSCAQFSYGEVEDYTILISSNGSIQPPVADFTSSSTNIEKGKTIAFSDQSTNTPTTWNWTFEGGNPATSTAQNPTVTYNNAGSYNVTLTAGNADGSDTKTMIDYIQVISPVIAPVADFAATQSAITEGESVTFSDLSTSNPSSWNWTFEGGTPATSTAQNPKVTYASEGIYSVTLKATNSSGSDTKTATGFITVNRIPTPPEADFVADITSIKEGESVSFTDQSTNTPTSWNWTFEGGTPVSSTAQNPTVTYNTLGTYTVTLSASNLDGSDSESKVEYITVNALPKPPVADFTYDRNTIDVEGVVSFTDISTNKPTSWIWTFEGGDPATSMDQNPSVVYHNAGSYDVTLTAYNNDGEGTETKLSLIVVNAIATPPIADFAVNTNEIFVGSSVSFSDASANNPTSWVWTFEGGTPSTATSQNPTVTYNTTGTFNVSLTVSNSDGSDSETKSGYITVNKNPTPPVADFSYNTDVINEGESINFTDISSNSPTSWQWTFEGGNPATSTSQNQTVTYTIPGTYDVSLTVTNDDGSDTKSMSGVITVNQLVNPPVADFNADNTLITEGEQINFTDKSTDNPESWLWEFEGGTPASSTERNPKVSYQNPNSYRVSLTVTNKGGKDTKVIEDYIQVQKAQSEYCIPSPVASEEWILKVTIGDNVKSSEAEGYADFTKTIFTLESGISHSVELIPDFVSRSKFEYWAIWIDYDQNMEFSDSEKVFSASKSKSTVRGSITIPARLEMTTRMRVAMGKSDPTACGYSDLGEVEDYTVQIIPPQPEAPVADYAANLYTVHAGESVQFSDISANDPTTLSWTFEGGNPGTSTSANPTITYASAGTYSVSLTAVNSYGSDTKTGVITVLNQGEATYCTPLNLNSAKNFIRAITIGKDLDVASADGYSLSNEIVTLSPGNNHDVRLVPSLPTVRNFWRIWIDFNNDGDFDDADETLLVANNNKGEVVSSISIPTYASGETRMRISMKTGKTPDACDDDFEGEVQDYSVSFGGTFGASMASSANPFADEPDNFLTIYPNPTRDNVHLKISYLGNNDSYAVYNLLGSKIMEYAITAPLSLIDLSEQPSGIFIIVVNTQGHNYTEKIIKK